MSASQFPVQVHIIIRKTWIKFEVGGDGCRLTLVPTAVAQSCRRMSGAMIIDHIIIRSYISRRKEFKESQARMITGSSEEKGGLL